MGDRNNSSGDRPLLVEGVEQASDAIGTDMAADLNEMTRDRPLARVLQVPRDTGAGGCDGSDVRGFPTRLEGSRRQCRRERGRRSEWL